MTPTRRVLVINPNTTQAMTDGLRPLITSLNHTSIDYTFYTAPSGVASINNENDASLSANHCFGDLSQRSKLDDYDGFLVCCYSEHPLVRILRHHFTTEQIHSKIVTGIFEASIATCLQSLSTDQKFGIVSTGSQWEQILGEAVASCLGSTTSTRYAGTETTGLNADELHQTAKDEVNLRLKQATKRLLDKEAKAVCLGCAGMAGMDATIREACIEKLGLEAGKQIKIVDGVVAGAIYLDGALRSDT